MCYLFRMTARRRSTTRETSDRYADTDSGTGIGTDDYRGKKDGRSEDRFDETDDRRSTDTIDRRRERAVSPDGGSVGTRAGGATTAPKTGLDAETGIADVDRLVEDGDGSDADVSALHESMDGLSELHDAAVEIVDGTDDIAALSAEQFRGMCGVSDEVSTMSAAVEEVASSAEEVANEAGAVN